MNKANSQKMLFFLIILMLMGTILIDGISRTQMTIVKGEKTSNDTTDWWPMFCHDAANSAYSSCEISEKNKLLWTTKTDYMSSSSPAVVDGKIYVTTGYFWEGQILCIDLETGSFLWNYSLEDSIWVSPIVIDNFVYIAVRGGRMLCLDSSTGALIWDTTMDQSVGIFEESPAFYNGKLYVACSCFDIHPENNNSALYCLDAYDGSIVWSYPTGTSLMFSPCVSDGKVYTIGLNNRLTCLDTETGNELWIVPDLFSVYHPIILNDKIYVGTLQGDAVGGVACIKDGEVLWEYHPASDYVVSTTIVGRNNSIYFGTGTSKITGRGKVVCLNAETGEEQWIFTSKGHGIFTSKPALTKDFFFVIEEDYDVPYLSSGICSFDVDTGERVWYYAIGMTFDNYINGGIAIADDKILVSIQEDDDAGEVRGGVYCFGEGEGNLPPFLPDTEYDKMHHQIVIRSTDPEGHKIRYGLSWDSVDTHKVDDWTNFYESGEEIRVECKQKKGVVGIIAEDEHGAQSDWVQQKSESMSLHQLLLKLGNTYPYVWMGPLYTIVKQLLRIV
jgi:outer membrane protein assembly factor BamB